MYTVTLTLGKDSFIEEGETILEALRAMQKPQKIIGKGTLEVTDGTKSTGQLSYNVPRLKRLFYPMYQPYAAKGLAILMQ